MGIYTYFPGIDAYFLGNSAKYVWLQNAQSAKWCNEAHLEKKAQKA